MSDEQETLAQGAARLLECAAETIATLSTAEPEAATVDGLVDDFLAQFTVGGG